VFLSGLLLGCSSAATQPQPLFAVSEEQQPEADRVGEAPQCVDQDEQQVTCLSDADCCSGFVCGKDPELSKRQSYCIYGG
jgi:hypothetical protein